jgi:hypothetical protein
MTQVTQKNGLQDRLGNGYAKFGRAGSVWRWEYTWNNFYGKNRENKQDGYDKGFLKSNAEIFERLKTRFLKSVILDCKYYDTANNFKVFLCDGQTKKEDKLIFMLRFTREKDCTVAHFELCDFAKMEFSIGSQNYMKELFTEFELKIKNKSAPQKTIKELVNELNGMVDRIKAEKIPQNLLVNNYHNAIDEVFQYYPEKVRQDFKTKVTPKVINQKLFFVFPESADLEKTREMFGSELSDIAQMMNYDDAALMLNAPKRPQTVQNEVNNLVQKLKTN